MTIEQIKAKNKVAGFHFFSPDTMRFFKSRVSSETFHLPNGENLFITSEQNKSSYDLWPRMYTIRRCTVGGDIKTVGMFQQFKNLSGAKYRAKRIALQYEKAYSEAQERNHYLSFDEFQEKENESRT